VISSGDMGDAKVWSEGNYRRLFFLLHDLLGVGLRKLTNEREVELIPSRDVDNYHDLNVYNHCTYK
jgi:hypothetical protein